MLDFGPGSFFLTPSQILDSPSFRDGVPSDAEKSLRFYGCEIIQEAGILLRLPQVVAATAQVLFHRFFCKKSMFCHDVRAVVASSFWLSMKLEEEKGASNRGGKPSKLNDVVSMFEHIRARREGVQPLPPHSPAFKLLKDEVLKLEMRMLIEFGFVCNVEHPHKLLLGILNSLEASKELIQESWNLYFLDSQDLDCSSCQMVIKLVARVYLCLSIGLMRFVYPISHCKCFPCSEGKLADHLQWMI